MNKQQLLERMCEAGLSRITADVEPMLMPSIRLFTQPTPEADIPTGASKIGGSPDLPPGFQWPCCLPLPESSGWADDSRLGGPLRFLAQINCADIAPYDTEHALPTTGLLTFFCAIWRDGFPWNNGDDSWLVIHSEVSLSSLQRTSQPPSKPDEGYSRDTHPCALHFEEYYALPGSDVGRIGLTEAEWEIMCDNLCEFMYGKDKEYTHLLLGRSQDVQGDMEWECEAFQPEHAHTWIQWHNMSSAEHKQFDADMHEKGKKEWRLLLQVETDPNIDLEWNGWGMGYFWIRRDDLAARDFDHTCLVNQHT